MATNILPEFVCERGHRWRIDGEPAGRSEGVGRRCPVCRDDPSATDPPLGGGGGDGPSGPYLAPGFAEGATLSDHLGGAPLPVVTAAEVVETLASAVHAAQGQGLRHGGLTTAPVALE